MYLVSFLAAYISYILSFYANASELCWFGDRDAIMEYGDNITSISYDLNFWGLLWKRKFPLEKIKILGIGEQAKNEKKLWYDELIRIPDHIAGTLASWKLDENLVDKPKHCQILKSVLSDNSNLGIIRLNITKDGSIQAYRINLSQKPYDN